MRELTTDANPSVNAAIAGIDEGTWTAIRNPEAFVDVETGEPASDAQVAELP